MGRSNARIPVVAGQFYPAIAGELRKQIETFVTKGVTARDAVACLLPHAGYIYSGRVAGATLSAINIKNNCVLLGPNHTGNGPEFSIMPEGSWQTPLGEVKINSLLAKRVLEYSKHIESDTLAHQYEHSLEVELPFLQYFKDTLEIIPIVVASDNIERLKEVGIAVAKAIEDSVLCDSTLIIASSDMTHYEPQNQALKKDKEAINAILEMDEYRLMDTVKKLNISMCGYAPSIIMLTAAKLLGAKKSILVKYETSAETNGDKESVVGYAGMVLYQ